MLNRLVREGVITAFRTNIADRNSALGLHVIVTADGTAARDGPAAGDAGPVGLSRFPCAWRHITAAFRRLL